MLQYMLEIEPKKIVHPPEEGKTKGLSLSMWLVKSASASWEGTDKSKQSRGRRVMQRH